MPYSVPEALQTVAREHLATAVQVPRMLAEATAQLQNRSRQVRQAG